MRLGPVVALTVALATALAGPAAAEGARAVFVGSFTWPNASGDYSGMSGIDIAADGVTFRVVEDTGRTFAGRFERDATGRVTGVRAGPVTRLRGEDGRPLGDERWDAEGIAFGPSGGFYVSFERDDRVSWFAGPDAPEKPLTRGVDLSWAVFNKGLEALAADGQGRLYAMTEVARSRAGGHPVLRYDGGKWSVAFSIPVKGRWRVVGADFGPDGRLYVLERDFWGLVGFRTRILRITVGDGAPEIETLLETQAGRHDNLEGIAAWAGPDGRVHLTLVSDDNKNMLQRSEVVEYRVEE